MLQDVGFDYNRTGGKDNQIIDVYFHHHFPKAVRRLACCPPTAANKFYAALAHAYGACWSHW
jgi:hypothetical protein